MARILATPKTIVRLTPLLGLLLTALFAGCASSPGAELPAEPAADRLSTAPPEDAPRVPTRIVNLGSSDVVGLPGVEHVFEVDIPADAVLLRGILTIRPGVVQELAVQVPACDLLHLPSAGAGTGTVIVSGECEPQARGLQQATLVFEAGAFVGTLAFEAEVPA